MDQLIQAKEFLLSKAILHPEAGIVLGTGLNRFLDFVDIQITLPYEAIPGFALSTVAFHKGQLIYGTMGGKNILVMQGRFHSYEGYSMQQIIFPIRVMRLLGIKHLFLSNAAGAINPDLKKTDLVMIKDHINLQTTNPLTGENREELGPRFPDMSNPYDPGLQRIFEQQAAEQKIPLKKAVYAAVTGPNLETRAEYRFLKTIGADIVGMSTVPEVIAANHMQLACAAISVITDECDPDHLQPVNIDEIIAIAQQADEKLAILLRSVILSL